MDERIENIIIKKADIYINGGVNFSLRVKAADFETDFGEIYIGGTDPQTEEFSEYEHTVELITNILLTVGATSLSALTNKYARVKIQDNRIVAIGNIIDDKWFSPEDFINTYRERDEALQHKPDVVDQDAPIETVEKPVDIELTKDSTDTE